MKNIKILNLDIYITKDYDAMSKKAAEILASVVNEIEEPVLGLATGGTPAGMYKEIIRMNKANQVDFSKVTTFNLDEYYPISKENNQSYHYFMKEHLFNHVNIDMNKTHVPDGSVENCEEEAEAYDKQVRATGGVDLQVLGIGSNAHIAFNEPGDNFPTKTQRTKLTKETIQDNARFFDNSEEVPKEAISMGIGTIMNSKRIMLLASGKNKAEAIKASVLGEVKPQIPGSILQFHKDVTMILDKDAAAELLKALE